MAISKPFTVSGIKVVSPKGKALWCKVKEPERKFNPKGTYATTLVCDPEDSTVQLFITKLEELRDAALAETKTNLKPNVANKVVAKEVYTEQYDSDGNPTGMVEFKFKLDNIDDKDKGKNKIDVVDANRNIVKDVPLIGNDSIIKCMAYANPYYMASTNTVGVSLLWKSMQIIKLNEYSSGASSDFDEEEGYIASDISKDFDAESEDDSGDY